MKTREVLEAIEQLKTHCKLAMDAHEAGVGEYKMLSARSGLYELGYNEDQADAILEQIADGGFSYCLDHKIKCQSGVDSDTVTMIYPDVGVCIWGADQLLSRLNALYW